MGHSQLGADEFVLSLFPSRPGFFVDVGAADGIALSNSYALEAQGWRGVAIDPLLKNFQGRSCVQLQVAVHSQKDVELEFMLCEGDPNMSGFSQDLSLHKPYIMQQGNHRAVTLRTCLLGELLEQVGAPTVIEYLSLDTEGSEYEILRTFPFNRYTFGVITVEHNYEQPKRQLLRSLLEAHGYSLVSEVLWDDWYVHVSLAQQARQVLEARQAQQQQAQQQQGLVVLGQQQVGQVQC